MDTERCDLLPTGPTVHFRMSTEDRPAEEPEPFDRTRSLQVAQQRRLVEDLHMAVMHNDTASEFQSKRMLERLEHFEEDLRKMRAGPSSRLGSDEVKVGVLFVCLLA